MPILSFPAAKHLGITVNELVHNAALQAKCMEHVAHGTETLAAVSLMDLSVEAEAFGATVRFSENEVPAVTGIAVGDEEAAEALCVPELNAGRLPITLEAVRQAKNLIGDKPIFAGMIGPFSLAGRLMDVNEIMYQLYDMPETVHTVMKKVTDFLVRYGQALKKAGADGIIMAEPLCGLLGREMAAEFSHPYVKQIINEVQDESFSLIYHNCGNTVPMMAQDIYALGATGYHFGNAVSMSEMLSKAPDGTIVMGNLDPVACLTHGTPETIRQKTKEMLEECGGMKGYIPSSGCDIPWAAPWENILAFFNALKQ